MSYHQQSTCCLCSLKNSPRNPKRMYICPSGVWFSQAAVINAYFWSEMARDRDVLARVCQPCWMSAIAFCNEQINSNIGKPGPRSATIINIENYNYLPGNRLLKANWERHWRNKRWHYQPKSYPSYQRQAAGVWMHNVPPPVYTPAAADGQPVYTPAAAGGQPVYSPAAAGGQPAYNLAAADCQPAYIPAAAGGHPAPQPAYIPAAVGGQPDPQPYYIPAAAGSQQEYCQQYQHPL